MMHPPLLTWVAFFVVHVFTGVLALKGQSFPSRDFRTAGQIRTSEDGGLLNGGTTAVQWDNRSLVVEGKRVIVWSGEFHFWRLPVPDLWRDILQKFKAAGFNTVSTYVHWGAINPSEGRVEWDAYRNFELFLQVAQQVGLWVIARPGPYINGESSAGGIPGRVTNIKGYLRSNDTDYFESYQDYYRSAVEIVQRYQISEGGPVIIFQVENEYTNNTNFATPNNVTKNEYMQALEDILHELGIVVPLTSNDSYEGENFAPGWTGEAAVGAVEVYGLDSYPQGGCDTPYTWSDYPVDYWSYHLSLNPTQPWLIPEFQGGSYLGWGPNSPEYPACNILTGSDFEQVYYLNQFATGVRLNNIYMTYGGTSWGHFAFPGVYTSYDYGASIAEDRTLTGKWFELKNIGTFIRSVETDLAGSDIYGNSSAGYTNNPSVFVTELRNKDTDAAFYVVRQNMTSSEDTVSAKINITTSLGDITIPQTASINVTLEGRQSRLFVVDHQYGNSSILYSTASLFYSGTIGSRDVVFLHGPSGQSFEVVIKTGTTTPSFSGSVVVNISTYEDYSFLTFAPSTNSSSVSISNDSIVIVGDTGAASLFHAPIIPGSDGTTYFGTSTNTTILLQGLPLVRNATITDSSLDLFGDTSIDATVTLYVPESVTDVTWNGVNQNVTSSTGFLTFDYAYSPPNVTAPSISGWKYADSLPEIQANFDDSAWTDANHTNSSNPFFKYYGEYYLYACEYEFCEGPVLWRGHFNSAGSETAVNLSISGGRAFAGSVWLNDVFLGATYGNSSNNDNDVIVATTNQTYSFPDGALLNGSNVVTVLHDNMGMEEANANQYTEWLKSPRGIQGYELLGGETQPTWKVQGKLGGYSNFPDRVRGIMNEGGLYGERVGWHLPGFDDSAWELRTPAEGLSSAGVGFFRANFELDIPSGTDAILSFNFPPYGNGTYRAFLYVNGWNFGRYVANLGPQSRFPVPVGILNPSGNNTVALAVWATGPDGASIGSFELTVDSVAEGGTGPVATNNPEWEARDVV